MQIKSVIPYILALTFVCGCGNADKTARKGEAALAIGEYYGAAEYFKKAYTQTPSKDKPKRALLALKMGQCYAHIGYASRALGAFQNAIRYGLTDTTAYFQLGEMQRLTGQYKSAAQSYENHLKLYPNDTLAMRGLESCRTAPELKEKGSAYEVKEAKWLSGTRADFTPVLTGEKNDMLIFTSTRNQATGDELSEVTGTKYADLFYAKKDEKGNWKRPELIEGGLNTTLDEGACCVTPDGQTMYLTVCRTDPQYPRMAEIWKSTRTDAKWSKAQEVKITADTLSIYAHPAVSPDGKYLYFTSDMPGGYGGLDLWRVPMDEHGMGAVENLGPDINTAGNEVFPTCRPNGELYFSSNGRGGMGGLDIYRAREDTVSHHWSVSHLPAPVNSYADDFSMTFEGLHNRGYFSSNRSTGGRGWDKIFEFSYPEILQSVKGWVYEQDGYELPAAIVYMVGNDGTNLKLSVKSDGSFEQEVKPGVDYLFLATCKGYLNIRNQLSVPHVQKTEEYVLQFPLPSISIPVLVRNVFYAFDKADILETSQPALERLTQLLQENPNITIELGAHCDYRGTDSYNDDLSQRRAESVVGYLRQHGIEAARLTPKGYGKRQPKIVTQKLVDTYPFLHLGDTLTEAYIKRLPPEQQEDCNAINRRTEFRVLRTTYGLFDEKGRLRPDLIKPQDAETEEPADNGGAEFY